MRASASGPMRIVWALTTVVAMASGSAQRVDERWVFGGVAAVAAVVVGS
jgi:hypothetical protein